MPPVFRQKIEPLEINVGSSAKFECETEDAPNVTFKWYKSGIEIKQSDKYRILSRHTSSCLELVNPVKADSSEYTCKASNQHGTDSCTASLIVTGKTPGVPLNYHSSTVSVFERERELYTYVHCLELNRYDATWKSSLVCKLVVVAHLPSQFITGLFPHFLQLFQLVCMFYPLLRNVPTSICIKTRPNDFICGQTS